MFKIIFFVCLGIGIFILGLIILTAALKSFSKNRIRNIIDNYTGNIYISLLIGFVLTVIIQSSSMVTVISVSMADAGLLKLYNAAGIIMGANIGTTIAVQLYAFDLFALTPYAVLLGSILHFQKSTRLKFLGDIILGFGIIFAGLKIMDIAVEPLRKIDEIRGFMEMMANPIYGVLTGIIIALIMQSSTVGIAMLQVLATAKLLPVYNALFIIYGLNIGTCSEAFIMSFATNKEGKKIAIFNILFNIIGTILFIPMTKYYYYMLQYITPKSLSHQIANGHMFFNIISTIIIIPIIKYIFRFIELLMGKDI
ncbi:Na/Pi symporter [Thermoanaerobacterium sp. RBIITD]|uniref:Na/Pi cotransporter family protein n=1 Tax=Thermoanaerobacterium sp. RBIITD TaxID=1550240 RepID=UPI000BB7B18B|nr:Na/Pi symporter [Thermoanaerobacterium sp. RBIITD]SNX54553.1 phosphate:Na+ symporter [Thermoanaerobacterium sp. RBIITD]